ncbi:hypothetical protein GUJ93_ZPchr0013g35488 [Zizania palustris]|uniref:Uncharacterized protein n=1 Tax=Zizania palustris TaxID=103762 RepID=A0A8J6C6B6_ZIZPA|nr:hypothetical protein GUJ93_ZPchr0013g35488 [Zizania palustris]
MSLRPHAAPTSADPTVTVKTSTNLHAHAPSPCCLRSPTDKSSQLLHRRVGPGQRGSHFSVAPAPRTMHAPLPPPPNARGGPVFLPIYHFTPCIYWERRRRDDHASIIRPVHRLPACVVVFLLVAIASCSSPAKFSLPLHRFTPRSLLPLPPYPLTLTVSSAAGRRLRREERTAATRGS